MIELLLKNASISSGASLDFAIDRGRIIDSGPELDYPAQQVYDLGGHLLIPGFVESHLHLDIALMNDPVKPGRQEAFLSVGGLNGVLERRRKLFSRQDIEQRAGRALEMASRQGVTAMRAQCHVDLEVGLNHLEALLSVKEKFAHLMDLQIVAFPQQGLLARPQTLDLFQEAFRLGATVMGCACNLDRGAQGTVDFRRHIDAAFDLALKFDVDLDIHADLGLPGCVALDDLEAVYTARRAVELGYQGRVTAGHLCALDSADPDVAAQVIDIICQAEMSVVSQPDMYRLAREDTSHVRRGLTRVKQLMDAGVNVTYASNNVRDAMRPVGNFDLLEEGLILSYGAHMDTVEELEKLLEMSTYHAACALRLKGYGLSTGCQADLVVLDAVSPSDAIVSQAEKLFIFKAGHLVGANRVISETPNRRLE